MSFVILTKNGLEQRDPASIYSDTFYNQNDNALYAFADIISRLNARNDVIIEQQYKIFKALGGEEGFQKIVEGQNINDGIQINDLTNIIDDFSDIQDKHNKLQKFFDQQLLKEQEFQDYMLQSLSKLEQISGQQIPANKFNSLIQQLKQSWHPSETNVATDDQLLNMLKQAHSEEGAELEKKYQYLNTILAKMKHNPYQIRKTANGFEISGLDKNTSEQQQKTIKKLLPLLEDLIKYFESFSNDKTTIINKLQHWRVTTRKTLAKEYAQIIKELQSLSD